MKCVYEASSGLEGHMILNLLKQAHISGRIDGEYLQGGIGELQAMNFVRVLVPEQDYTEARKIIHEWESVQPVSHESGPATRPERGMQTFAIGMIVGAVLMYWLLKMSAA